jgi:hypothetical protein
VVDLLAKQANTLKVLREASGAVALEGADVTEIIKQQTDLINETQDHL